MIKTRKELKEVLKAEHSIYIPEDSSFELYVCSENQIYIWKFQRHLRYTEYHHNNKGIFHKILYTYHRRKKCILGRKLGIEIWDNTFGKGLQIYHSGNIVVNGMSKIGKNCKLHGSNCIGNNGKTLDSPVIGDNVRIGVGAKIIGKITIADNITIGAGAVVINSFFEEGITIAGIPARKVKDKD